MVLCACGTPSVASNQQPVRPTTQTIPQPAVSATSKPSSHHANHTEATPAHSQAPRPKGKPISVRIARPGKVVLQERIAGPIGLPASGVLEPTDDTVRWYHEGTWPKPGYPGPSVLVGHVTFPVFIGTVKIVKHGVFWNLYQAKPGDTITVGYSSGQAVAFRVTAVQVIDKQLLRTPSVRNRVWNHTLKPELRIVTCDANSPNRNNHFQDNIIVYADKMLVR